MIQYASIFITIAIQVVTGVAFIMTLKTKITVLQTEVHHLRNQLASMFLTLDEKIKLHVGQNETMCNLRHEK